jgi:hypothetical protein
VKARFQALLAEYGPIALGTYLGIFALSMAGFSAAIAMGFEVDGAAGGLGTLGAAWVATKVVQIPRFLLTFALTPLVARVVRRGAPPESSGAAPEPSAETEP